MGIVHCEDYELDHELAALQATEAVQPPAVALFQAACDPKATFTVSPTPPAPRCMRKQAFYPPHSARAGRERCRR